MNIISTYTRKEAIEDGYQYPLSELISNELKINLKMMIKYPIFLTTPVVEILNTKTKGEDIDGKVYDMVFALYTSIKRTKNDSDYIEFEVILNKSTIKLYGRVGATDIDNPEPAITIMANPSEE